MRTGKNDNYRYVRQNQFGRQLATTAGGDFADEISGCARGRDHRDVDVIVARAALLHYVLFILRRRRTHGKGEKGCFEEEKIGFFPLHFYF